MILFFRTPTNSVIATECNQELNAEDVKKLCWLYSDATVENEDNLKGWFIGPRREMITPWSTNAVEITQNMGLNGIRRIEEYFPVKDENADHDPMLQRMYHGLDQEIFTVDIKPQPIIYIENLEEYNEKEGLALSREEMDYLMKVEKDLGRKLTDSEVFGFAHYFFAHIKQCKNRYDNQCNSKCYRHSFLLYPVYFVKSTFFLLRKFCINNIEINILAIYFAALTALR